MPGVGGKGVPGAREIGTGTEPAVLQDGSRSTPVICVHAKPGYAAQVVPRLSIECGAGRAGEDLKGDLVADGKPSSYQRGIEPGLDARILFLCPDAGVDQLH
jgi:hypothetical protein